MRMVCPDCSAAYEVPDSLLAPGRQVRCARCGNQWAPVAAEAAPAPAPPPAIMAPPVPHWPDAEVIEEVEAEPVEALPPDTPRFTAMDRLALHQANVRSNPVPLRMAWVASILTLLLLIAGFFAFRVEVAQVWPASHRLYDALGVMQPPSGKP